MNLKILLFLGLAILVYGLYRSGRGLFQGFLKEYEEDLVKLLYTREHEEGERMRREGLPSLLGIPFLRSLALNRLRERGFVLEGGGVVQLTEQGREQGLRLVRAHRLWEQHLAEETEVPLPEIHRRAEEQEHRLKEEEIENLAARLGHPTYDPHGDPIPSPYAQGPRGRGTPLPLWSISLPGQVSHIEDEPEQGLRELLGKIQPGDEIVVVEKGEEGYRIRVQESCRGSERELSLSPEEGKRLHLVPSQGSLPRRRDAIPLSELPLYAPGIIVELSRELRGMERRRLLDLGFTPGTVITPELRTRLSRQGPRAYRVRGTLIALRNRQAEKIQVRPLEPNPLARKGGSGDPA